MSILNTNHFIALWARIRPLAQDVFDTDNDGTITLAEAIPAMLKLYPKAYDFVDGLGIPDETPDADGVSKHNLVCEAMDQVWDSILDPDIAWIPNWAEDSIIDPAVKFGLHWMTHVLYERAHPED